MLDWNCVVCKEANFSFELIGVARILGQDQQWTLAAGRESLRELGGCQRATGTDQAAPGGIVTRLRKLQVGGKK